MNKKFTYYFIPIFLLIYFFIALIPVVNNRLSEFFPFFSFKLYSKVPTECTNYDVLLDKGLPTESFLLYENTALSRFERRTYSNRISEMVKNYEKGNAPDLISDCNILENVKTATLVKISGDCIDRVRDNTYEIEVIKVVK